MDPFPLFPPAFFTVDCSSSYAWFTLQNNPSLSDAKIQFSRSLKQPVLAPLHLNQLSNLKIWLRFKWSSSLILVLMFFFPGSKEHRFGSFPWCCWPSHQQAQEQIHQHPPLWVCTNMYISRFKYLDKKIHKIIRTKRKAGPDWKQPADHGETIKSTVSLHFYWFIAQRKFTFIRRSVINV